MIAVLTGAEGRRVPRDSANPLTGPEGGGTWATAFYMVLTMTDGS